MRTPAPVLGIDFETCSAVDLDHGSEVYAEHETTRVHCAVLSLSRQRGDNRVFRWFPGLDVPAWAVRHVEAGGLVLAHNASFESSILRHILAPFYGWPSVRVEQWVDSLLIAASVGLPQGLGKLGPAIGAKVLKDDEGNKLMRSVMRVKRNAAGNWVYPELTPEILARLALYCERDVLSMVDCYWKLPRPTLTERAVMVADRRINERGVVVNLERAAAMKRMAKARAAQISEELWGLTGDLIGVSSVPVLVRWLTDLKVELPKARRKRKDGTFHFTPSLGAGSIAEILRRPELPEIAHTVLTARIEAGKMASLAKVARAPLMISGDGRLHNALNYCGAHTGRWSSKGLQIHNLAKVSKAFKPKLAAFAECVMRDDIIGAAAQFPVLIGLSGLMRSIFQAREGFELLGADFAAIEARVLAWLAGNYAVLELFAAGQDVYVAAAAQIGSDNRDLGKVAVLALGYGMGPVKFADTAAKAGVPLSLKEARRVTLLWRKANAAVKGFWGELEQAFRDAIEFPGHDFYVGNFLIVQGSRACVRIILPSGRALHYWRPSTRTVERRIETVNEDGDLVVKTVMMNEIRFFKAGKMGMAGESTYSGKLAENVTQAVARDLMAEAILRLEDTGRYPVVMHVHDSIASEVPAGTGNLEEFCALMAYTPSWADGLPVAAEGYRSRQFKG